MDGNGSQEIDYDMGAGWRYRIRLFSEDEKKEWADELSKITDEEYVGAQWNANKVKEPPDVF